MGESDQRSQLSHLGQDGGVKMVDVGDKTITRRRAVAEGRVRVSEALARAIREDEVAKGNLLEVARIAGVQAAKQTDRLIPLCHSLPLESVRVDASLEHGEVRLTAEVQASAKTGVEMEALTAVAVAALTVVDMGKAIDRGMVIESIRLREKTGGTGGDYRAPGRPGSKEPG